MKVRQSDIGVIIVAGGRGTRMGASTPKQFLPLSERRCVLEVTVERFAQTLPGADIVVVLPADSIASWHEINSDHGFDVPHTTVAGGDTRFGSVAAGLAALPHKELVAVTDGVRPFVTPEMITRLIDEAADYGSAVASLPVTDTLRRRCGEGSTSADRNEYFTVQTPQVFAHSVLQRAYTQPFDERFTDDASVVEALGLSVHYTTGDRGNIKLTTPEELVMARAIYALRGL
ncbi:MAG: 2-C-methyl-D-erythritol 4-phosphate cytidylyltransferase [Rikenellaceae bacterium]|nr:2-C-methyl-D-erythritol 4-phosphate cytidylyltransferase [Rikenellaceae bacterium]